MNDTENMVDVEEASQEEKIFTQAELNKIVSDRLAKEKARYELELSKREKEAKRKERIADIGAKLFARGLPADGIAEMWCDLPEELVAKNMETLDAIIAAGIDKGVNERFKTNPVPRVPQTTPVLDGMRLAMGLKK